MSSESKELSAEEMWRFDEIIMRWWDAKDADSKKKIELECYKELKATNFNSQVIDYLHANEADPLADEMEHFVQIYQKVPHEHEKYKVA